MSAFRRMLARLMDAGMPEFTDREGEEETSPDEKVKTRAYVVKKIGSDDEEDISPEEQARKKKKRNRDIVWEN